MAALERTYNIPLRKQFLKTQKYRRAKKALTTVKEFLVKHMKSSNVKIGEQLNKELWKHGIKNPPHHIKVNVVKEDDGLVKAELVGHKYVEKKKVKKEEKGALGEAAAKLKEKLGGGKEKKEKAIEDKLEEVKDKKAEKAKEIEKEEIKELKEEKKKETTPPKEVKEHEPEAAQKAPKEGQKLAPERRDKKVQ